ncbi:hypothetical protein FPV67DRAFT_1676469 [Lyophyllum atratum]|nr:hypothetical protein FPV67DRAFT_1676469 [Lyophyllum atratum]
MFFTYQGCVRSTERVPALLVWPIWKAARHLDEFSLRAQDSRGHKNNTMKHLTQVIIESGLLYTVVALITFVTFTVGSPSLYVVSNAEIGIAGIAFNLIIIRTAQATRVKSVTGGGGTLSSLRVISPRHNTGREDEKSGVRFVVSHHAIAEDTVQEQTREAETSSSLRLQQEADVNG